MKKVASVDDYIASGGDWLCQKGGDQATTPGPGHSHDPGGNQQKRQIHQKIIPESQDYSTTEILLPLPRVSKDLNMTFPVTSTALIVDVPARKKMRSKPERYCLAWQVLFIFSS